MNNFKMGFLLDQNGSRAICILHEFFRKINRVQFVGELFLVLIILQRLRNEGGFHGNPLTFGAIEGERIQRRGKGRERKREREG